MKCLHPIHVKVRDKFTRSNPYSKVKSNYRLLPCGKCIVCRMRRAMQWGFRLEQEWHISENCCFITLTYAPEFYPSDGNLVKDDYLKFMKCLAMDIRRYCELFDLPYKFRYLGVGEYGFERGRAHYHGILFNVPVGYFSTANVKLCRLAERFLLNRFWKKGFVTVSELTGKRIMYASKYVVKSEDFAGSKVHPFMTCSKRPPLGLSYLTPKIVKYHHDADVWTVQNDSGYWLPLPRIYWPYIWSKTELYKHSAEMEELEIEQMQQIVAEDYETVTDDKDLRNPYNGLTKSQVKDIEQRFRRKEYERHMRRKHFRGIS